MENNSKTSTETSDFYETKDWTEASLLLTERLPMKEVRQIRGNLWFIFSNPEKANKIIEQYFTGTLQVNVREFVDNQRRVKDMVHHRGGPSRSSRVSVQ